MAEYTTSIPTQEIPYGYCHCGCGEKTWVPVYGQGKGIPKSYKRGHGSYKDFATRFWEKISASDLLSCWIWTGTKTSGGYGHIYHVDKAKYAHRLSYEMFIGPIPEGLFVCHTCDNPGCVNPSHLFVGTNTDNMADMMAKGRKPPREAVPYKCKVTDDQVREIRAKYASGGATHRSLAAEYGVKHSTIGNIVRYQTFKHISWIGALDTFSQSSRFTKYTRISPV